MDKITHEMRLMQWTPIIKSCHNSGISIRSWCAENNVNTNQFHYWQRRLRKEVYETLKETESHSKPNFVQLSTPVESLKNKSVFKADMILHIENNVIELTNSVSEELLARVLKVISNAK